MLLKLLHGIVRESMRPKAPMFTDTQNKNHIIISTDAEKISLQQNSTSLHGKSTEERRNKRIKFQHITNYIHFEHVIKTGAHKGGVRIGKTPKKLANICCP
jgi:hypothetical protein